jgi:exodeoxyribonuclease VII large subunit
MGMFAPEYKKPIPPYVRKLGVVTASTGAAIRDIINISSRRNPGIQLILYPAKVQGEGAAESIAEGIAALDELGLDAIIVGRGGGSIEDLWAFNEETVARAIFGCQTPVISAVGHETDTTIADFVADLRAPTPSAAAELAVADTVQLQQQIEGYRDTLQRRMNWCLERERVRSEQFRRRFDYASPAMRIREQRMRLASLEDELRARMDTALTQRKHQMMVYIERMRGLSPLEKLAQGYAAASNVRGERIFSIEQVEDGDVLDLYVSDGKICAAVQGKEALTR